MRTGIGEALLLTLAMGAAIFFCRVFPFLFLRKKTGNDGETGDGSATRRGERGAAFLAFVEKTVPPVAMTVLAFNALAGPARTNPGELLPGLAAAAVTAALHLWRRNPMISIFAGTALFMVLTRIFG